MAEQPFIFFPRPAAGPRKRVSGGGRKYAKPTAEEQRQRLDQKFQQIALGFTDLMANMAGLEPEQVIVLETISGIDNVAKAAARIPGLEWLAESDLAEVDPEFGFQDEADVAKKLPRRLYALFSNQAAMDQLIGLWRQWLDEPAKRATTGFGPFKQLFIHLRDIRRWGPEDRIATTGLLDSWREDLEVMGNQGSVLFEIELWFRGSEEKRQQAYADLQRLVGEMGGQCIDAVVIPEILYHGVLAEVGAAVAQSFDR